MGVVHGKVGDDDGDGEGDGEHAADCAQAAHDHAQVSLDDGGERRRSDLQMRKVPTVTPSGHRKSCT